MSVEGNVYSLPTQYQEYIHLSRYSKFLWSETRRETWSETVGRYFNFFSEHLNQKHQFDLPADLREQLEEAVQKLHVMPSMRALMAAGTALQRNNIAGYNCSFVAVDRRRAFDEILYVLMNGTGVGFSVESQFINKLPKVAKKFRSIRKTIRVADSKEGWASAFRKLIAHLFKGEIPSWDVSAVRPAGAPLKTFGGRASGPGPLVNLFEFSVKLLQAASGRKLTAIEAHDLVCKIAEIVVVGGVRRSALISLSDLVDPAMQTAKSGAWWEDNVQRSLANNSASYESKPELPVFEVEWQALIDSMSGERGIFNREAATKQALKWGRRNPNHKFGTNPCAEISLRSMQFCNLTEVVIRAEDTLETLIEKVRLATIMGTFQSTLVDFKYLNHKWRKNCEEERLLGVSLTGIMDNEVTSGQRGFELLEEWLTKLHDVAVETNAAWAARLGINASVAITCGKPSGTVSQLVDAASGIHARYAPYYVRRVRADKKDPLAHLMVDLGFPVEDDVTKPDHTYVFSFPIKAPENAVFRDAVGAIDQLKLWLAYKTFWCEHSQSVTIYVKQDEWAEVGRIVYENFDDISGISFLPFSEHTYRQAPYEDLTEEQYRELLAKMPINVDWNRLADYETTDETEGAQTLACTAGGCEI